MAEASTIVFQTTLLPSLSSQFHHHYNHNPLFFSKPIRTPKTHNTLTPIQCSISTAATPDTASAVDRIPWGCEADSVENAEALQNWLTKLGLPPQKMRIEKVDVGERGLVANNNIRKGEKLLFVPPSLVITADSEWGCPEAGKVLKKNSVPDWPLLATYLISEASLMSSSRWSNYISALPRQPYSLLYCFSTSFQDSFRAG